MFTQVIYIKENYGETMITLATPAFLECSETYSSFEKETANENLKNSHIFFFATDKTMNVSV